MADLTTTQIGGGSSILVLANGLDNTVNVNYHPYCKQYKIVIKDTGASAIDLRAEDDASREAVQAIVSELNPMSFFVVDDNSGTMFITLDINKSDAAELQTRIRRIEKDRGASTTSIGPNDIDISGSTVTPATSVSIATTLSSVVIAGTAGQFTCTDTQGALEVGQRLTIAGTLGGGGAISGYSDPTTYHIIATNESTTFTLSATAGGAAISTTAGTPTGVTYTLEGPA